MTTDVLGAPIKRVEDPRFITGKGRYLDDINLTGMTHVAVLRSPYAHARIRSIDTSAATAMPGVVAVFTGADIPYNPGGAFPKLGGVFPDGFHAAFADGAVRFVSRRVDVPTLRTLVTRTADGSADLDRLP